MTGNKGCLNHGKGEFNMQIKVFFMKTSQTFFLVLLCFVLQDFNSCDLNTFNFIGSLYIIVEEKY